MILKTSPFGVDWDRLTLVEVEAYFGANLDESLTVEAKGSQVHSGHVTREVNAFANSDLGGFLVLGVHRKDRKSPWIVEGWEPPDESTTWVSNIVTTTMDPVPRIDVLPLPMGGSRVVTVVRVWPVPLPPSVTSAGGVFYRLPGKSEPAYPASVLQRLFDRGAAGQSRAWTESRLARDELARHTSRPELVVAMSCPSFASDISAELFREPVRAAVQRMLLDDDVRTIQGPPMQVRVDVDQHRMTGESHAGPRPRDGYLVELRRMGSVAIGLARENVDEVRWAKRGGPELGRMWRAASDLSRSLGAYGPTHLAIRVASESTGGIDIDRWTEVGEPSAEDLESVRRELLRSLNEFALEP